MKLDACVPKYEHVLIGFLLDTKTDRFSKLYPIRNVYFEI